VIHTVPVFKRRFSAKEKYYGPCEPQGPVSFYIICGKSAEFSNVFR
jgi:hypothetical protein